VLVGYLASARPSTLSGETPQRNPHAEAKRPRHARRCEVKIRLVYHVCTEVIRQERIATGDSPGEERSIEYDLTALTQEERKLLLDAASVAAHSYAANTVELRPYRISSEHSLVYSYQWLEQGHVLTPEQGIAAIGTLRATRAALLEQAEQQTLAEQKRKQAHQQKISDAVEQWLGLPRDRTVEVYQSLSRQEQQEFDLDSRVVERRAQWRREDEAQTTAEAEAKRVRKQAQIAAWVADHGTLSQQERLAAGLLDEAEVLDGIREQTFAPVSLPLYRKLVTEDVDHNEECGHYDVDYASDEAKDATEAEFDTLKVIRAALPAATVTLRRHTATCNTCDRTATRAGILAVVTVGEFDLRREFGVVTPSEQPE